MAVYDAGYRSGADDDFFVSVVRFRSEAELRDSWREAGFAVEAVYGGWHREPIGRSDGELLVLARNVSRSAQPERR